MGILLIKLINGLAWGKMTGNNDFDTPFPRGRPAIFPSNHFFDTVQSLHLDCCFNDFSSIYQYRGGEVNVDNAQLFNGQAPLQSRCSWSPSSPQIGEMCSSSCGNLNGGNQLWNHWMWGILFLDNRKQVQNPHFYVPIHKNYYVLLHAFVWK